MEPRTERPVYSALSLVTRPQAPQGDEPYPRPPPRKLSEEAWGGVLGAPTTQVLCHRARKLWGAFRFNPGELSWVSHFDRRSVIRRPNCYLWGPGNKENGTYNCFVTASVQHPRAALSVTKPRLHRITGMTTKHVIDFSSWTRGKSICLRECQWLLKMPQPAEY